MGSRAIARRPTTRLRSARSATPQSGTDSSRYLAAGAERSFWVRTRQGQLSEAMPRVRALLADSGNAIVESNSVLRFLQAGCVAQCAGSGR